MNVTCFNSPQTSAWTAHHYKNHCRTNCTSKEGSNMVSMCGLSAWNWSVWVENHLFESMKMKWVSSGWKQLKQRSKCTLFWSIPGIPCTVKNGQTSRVALVPERQHQCKSLFKLRPCTWLHRLIQNPTPFIANCPQLERSMLPLIVAKANWSTCRHQLSPTMTLQEHE